MSQRQFDYITFIGRCEPPHLGHFEILESGLSLSDKLIILVGSSYQPRTFKNPFTFAERKTMLEDALDCREGGRNAGRVEILPLRDFKPDNNIWASNVQKLVSTVVGAMGWTDKQRRGGIIGSSKDESSFYLHMFPQWELVECPLNEVVNATDIRTLYFESNIKYIQSVVPKAIYSFLEKFKTTPAYKHLLEEYEFIKAYRKSWSGAPYEPTFLTADAVVVQSGHILLIKRRSAPGKGLWALPGGFVNPNERIEDAAIRELREETKLKVPVPVIRGSLGGLNKDKPSKVFDAPDRSLRGRTVTQAFFIEFPAGELPEVRGSDDAEKAKWVPLSFVREEEMFEDHFSIICHFLGQLA